MNFKNGIIALFVIGLAVSLSGSTLERGITSSRFKALTEDNTTAVRTVSDAIPRVAVRIDDGRANIWGDGNAVNANEGATCQVQAFLRRGIPLSLAIIAGSVASGETSPGGKLTWDELKAIRAYGAERGADVEICLHGNDYSSGLWGQDYGGIVDFFSPQMIQDSLGVTPKVFVQPGDDGYREFAARNLEVITAILDSLGYDWADLRSEASLDSHSQNWCRVGVHLQDLDLQHNISNQMAPRFLGMMRPGMLTDRYFSRSGTNLDLLVVERDTSQASNASQFILREKSLDATGLANAYDLTFANLYSSMLADNMGCIIVFHDSLGTAGDTIAGLDEEESAGFQSPEHIAYVLKELEDAGHIVLCTVSEYYEWAAGRYMPGVDLISNPGMVIPQYDIGDTMGFEYAWPRGISTTGTNATAWNSTLLSSYLPLMGMTIDGSAGRSGKFLRSGADPSDFFGAESSERGYAGSYYGCEFPATGASPRYMQFSIGNLQPGRYRFSIALKWKDTGGLSWDRWYTTLALRSQDIIAGWNLDGAHVYSDTLLHFQFQEQGTNRTVNDPESDVHGDWFVYSVDVQLPNPITAAGTIFNDVYWARPDDDMGTGGTSPQVFGGTATYSERNWLWNEGLWAWSARIDFYGNIVMSYPRFRYLGP